MQTQTNDFSGLGETNSEHNCSVTIPRIKLQIHSCILGVQDRVHSTIFKRYSTYSRCNFVFLLYVIFYPCAIKPNFGQESFQVYNTCKI